jgi:hypothetical protein
MALIFYWEVQVAADLKQVYTNNPSTALADNDLLYVYKATGAPDSGIKKSDLFAQINDEIVSNKNLTLVYVNYESGTDAAGGGSELLPYKNVSYAQEKIIDATPDKPYCILVTGSYTDAGQIYISPNVFIVALSPQITITSSNTIIIDPLWLTAEAGTHYTGFQNISLNLEVLLDFTAVPSVVLPDVVYDFVTFNQDNVDIHGRIESTPTVKLTATNCKGGFFYAESVDFYDYDNYFSGNVFITGNSTVYNSNNSTVIGGLNIQFGDTGTHQSKAYIKNLHNVGGVNLTQNGSSSNPILLQVLGGTLEAGIGVTINDGINSGVSLTTLSVAGFSQAFFHDGSPSGNLITWTYDGASYPATVTVDQGTVNYNPLSPKLTLPLVDNVLISADGVNGKLKSSGVATSSLVLTSGNQTVAGNKNLTGVTSTGILDVGGLPTFTLPPLQGSNLSSGYSSATQTISALIYMQSLLLRRLLHRGKYFNYLIFQTLKLFLRLFTRPAFQSIIVLK